MSEQPQPVNTKHLAAELDALCLELRGYSWLRPEWREVRTLARQLSFALTDAEHRWQWPNRSRGEREQAPPTLGVSVSDGITAKDKMGG